MLACNLLRSYNKLRLSSKQSLARGYYKAVNNQISLLYTIEFLILSINLAIWVKSFMLLILMKE